MGVLAVGTFGFAVLLAAWWAGPDRAVQVLAALLLLVGLARAVLPDGAAGPLVVRSRTLDVSSCVVLAVLLLVATALVPTGS